MKYKYMHTIQNYPARYSGEQICFIHRYGNFIGKLVPTLKQIKKEQKLSLAWRKKQQFSTVDKDYGYIRVEI